MWTSRAYRTYRGRGFSQQFLTKHMHTQQKLEKPVSNRTDSSVSVDEKVEVAGRGPILFPTFLGRSKGLCSQGSCSVIPGRLFARERRSIFWATLLLCRGEAIKTCTVARQQKHADIMETSLHVFIYLYWATSNCPTEKKFNKIWTSNVHIPGQLYQIPFRLQKPKMHPCVPIEQEDPVVYIGIIISTSGCVEWLIALYTYI